MYGRSRLVVLRLIIAICVLNNSIQIQSLRPLMLKEVLAEGMLWLLIIQISLIIPISIIPPLYRQVKKWKHGNARELIMCWKEFMITVGIILIAWVDYVQLMVNVIFFMKDKLVVVIINAIRTSVVLIKTLLIIVWHANVLFLLVKNAVLILIRVAKWDPIVFL